MYSDDLVDFVASPNSSPGGDACGVELFRNSERARSLFQFISDYLYDIHLLRVLTHRALFEIVKLISIRQSLGIAHNSAISLVGTHRITDAAVIYPAKILVKRAEHIPHHAIFTGVGPGSLSLYGPDRRSGLGDQFLK